MSLTLAEARTRADQLSAISYDLELDLTGPSEDGTYRCRTTIRFDTRSPETFLELTGATDLRVTVDGTATTPAYDGRRITLSGLADRNEVVVEARVPYVTDGDGMYAFTDPADGERYVSAYLGMDVAQRVFPCFDQPDLKATIALTVTADPAWTVIANGRVTHHDGGEWSFTTTPPISTYLFVVCAGPWHSVTWEHELDGRRLPFGWHARRSLAAELDRDAEELKATTVACFDHYAQLFDEPYAFDSYDQAFVPGQNWGALETPGCVTYRDELLPRVRITDQDRMRRGTIIAHEMAHMWFGNLVTMRWWEDTWLNESFADYMGFRVGGEAAGFAGTLVAFEVQRKPGAYDADERSSTHPVAPEAEDVPHVDAAFSNFDAISYAKGNSVLRQLVTWLGDEDFLKGVNAHLTRHRFGNATLADFVDALDTASDRDVRGWVEAWLRTTGYDTLRIHRDGDVPVLAREGSRPHRVRVTAYDDELRERGSRLVDLGDDPVRLDDWAGLVVVPNGHGETFARFRLDEQSFERVTSGLAGLDDLARAVFWASTFELTHNGELTADAYLELVVRHLPVESDVAIVEAVLARTTHIVIPQRVAADRASHAVEAVAAACLTGLRQGPGEQLGVAFTRGLAATSHDAGLLRGWLDAGAADAGVTLDPALRWQVVRRLAELGAIDGTEIAAEEARDPSMGGQLGAAAALSARPDVAAKEEAWAAMVDDEQVSNRRFEYLAAGLWSVEQAELLRPFVRRYFTETPAVAERRGQAFCAVVGKAFPKVALDDEQLDLLRTALAGDLPAVLRRHWEDRYDDLVRARG